MTRPSLSHMYDHMQDREIPEMLRAQNYGNLVNDIRFEDQDHDSVAYVVSLVVSHVPTRACDIIAGAHVMKLSSATSSWRLKWLHIYTS